MQAGKLRHRVTFQSPSITQDPVTGAAVEDWVTTWDAVPASVEPLSMKDMIASQAVQSELTARIVIRYRTGVLPTMRILHRSMIYSIEGQPMPDAKSGLEYLTIGVSTGVNDG
jgi:SPP1 family predicted phage head-tail adaptor